MYINQASDLAYEYITNKIKEGFWKPGDKIATESNLMKTIGVSKIAVRQAIERLVTLSVLYKVQGSGTYVEKLENMSIMSASLFGLDEDFMLKILEFRKMFDSYNIGLFIEHATDQEVEELELNYAQMNVAKNDVQKFYKIDLLFHDIIATGTRNPMIIQISKLFMHILTDNQKQIYHNVGPSNAIEYHGKMLDAIKEKNAEVASIYARKSIEESIKRIEERRRMRKLSKEEDSE